MSAPLHQDIQQFSHWPAIPPPLRLPLVTTSDASCPYLPGRRTTTRAFWADRIAPDLYHRLMDAGFRRSGKVIYQPVCRGCRECVPIRVPVESFRPSKSQRRCARRNLDLTLTVTTASATEEACDLYTRYERQWHGTDAPHSRDQFEQFLYDSPVETIEFQYRDASARLLAVGICDVCRRSLSSVYFFFEPAESRRGLGTFGALREIDWARRRGIGHYYLGYHVAGCRAMQYKSQFRPCEVLGTDGKWRRFEG